MSCRWGEWLDHPNNLGENKCEWERGINYLLNLLKQCLSGTEIFSVIQGVWTMDCFGKADKQVHL